MSNLDKKTQESLNQYTLYMEEIKKRTEVVSKLHKLHLAGSSMTGYIETDIDLVYLQLRKITELIMFACVVANKSAGLALNKTLKKGWELKKIKAELKKYNTDFFPTPVYDDEPVDGLRKLSKIEHSEKPYLTENQLFEAYGFAANFLHSKREYKYGDQKKKIEYLNKGIDQVYQLVTLLNHHWIKISNKRSFAVIMQGKDDGKVHVALMEQTERQPNNAFKSFA